MCSCSVHKHIIVQAVGDIRGQYSVCNLYHILWPSLINAAHFS